MLCYSRFFAEDGLDCASHTTEADSVFAFRAISTKSCKGYSSIGFKLIGFTAEVARFVTGLANFRQREAILR